MNALTSFNLAPVASRRDVAMLGAIHRVVLGEAPAPIKGIALGEGGLLILPLEGADPICIVSKTSHVEHNTCTCL